MPLFDLDFQRCRNCGRPIVDTDDEFCCFRCEQEYIWDRSIDDDAADNTDHPELFTEGADDVQDQSTDD